MYYLFGIIYPLFRSSRIARGKECEESKLKILKYWVVFCIIQLCFYYMEWMLAYFDIGNLAITLIFFSLVVFDFALAEIVYHNIIFELFNKNEVLLHQTFKYLRRVLEGTLYKWIEMVSDIFFSLLSAVIPRLPAAIQTPLEFMGVTKYLEARMDKYKYNTRKKQEEIDYREYAKLIEKNRPESPMKTAKIERKDSTDKG